MKNVVAAGLWICAMGAVLIGCAAPSPAPPAPVALPATPPGDYGDVLRAAVRRNITGDGGAPPGSRCEVEVLTDRQGRILPQRTVSPGGHPGWCASVLRALERTKRLPLDAQGKTPLRILFVFNST